jgi:hypothetical protein
VQAAAGQSPAVATDEQLAALAAALAAAQVEFGDHVTGIWCEALGPMVALEWPAAREGLQRPVLRASSEALLSGPHACGPSISVRRQSNADVLGGPGAGGGGGAAAKAEGSLSQSARGALAAYVAVQRVVALLQLKEVGLCRARARLWFGV